MAMALAVTSRSELDRNPGTGGARSIVEGAVNRLRRQPLYDIGRIATNALLRLINGERARRLR
ncbi:hypothetical protein ACFDR9_004940 [Janthinobacterium sp. CG_23.3]|uniref:hypothetical protein n=1 Tax=Janthinobacterium sp. CG_23.3 TaxID=3349634 RepID=UPI0038D40471